jgi:MraZ protein
MFRGRYETIVDAKGRTSLPARYRDALTASDDNRMVLTTALDPCLVAYPYSVWA